MRWLERLFRRAPAPQNPAQNAITGQFVLDAQLAGSSGRRMTITGYLYDGESKESVEDRIDLLQEIIERQRIRSEIPELEAKREQMVKGMMQAREVLAELEDKQKRGEQLSSQERLNIKNMRVNIGKVNEEIDKGTAAIVEAKRMSARRAAG
jgi:hypothetical protein